MLKWYRDLYIGEGVRKQYQNLIAQLNAQKKVTGIYLITYALNQKNQLEIINSAFLVQKALYKLTPEVIGIAGTRREAVGIIADIVEACYRETGDADLRSYLHLKEIPISEK